MDLAVEVRADRCVHRKELVVAAGYWLSRATELLTLEASPGRGPVGRGMCVISCIYLAVCDPNGS